MKKLLLIAGLLAVVATLITGCQSHAGSREYTPGKGWQQN
jgi:hypothetical protein